MKNAYHITSNTKMQITNLACICANRNTIPPYVLFPGKTVVNPSYLVDLPPESKSFVTESGWMNTEAFYFWVKHVFLENLPPIRPVLLVLDGHTSHIDHRTGRFCQAHNIDLICLPPHTSHVKQPLDKGIFGPVKQTYRKLCNQFCQQYPGSTINKYTFGRIFGQAWMKSMTQENVIHSFKSTGLWQFNPDAVDYSKMDAAKLFPIEPATPSLLPPTDDAATTTSEVSTVFTNGDVTPASVVGSVSEMDQDAALLNTLPGCSKDVPRQAFTTSSRTPYTVGGRH